MELGGRETKGFKKEGMKKIMVIMMVMLMVLEVHSAGVVFGGVDSTCSWLCWWCW